MARPDKRNKTPAAQSPHGQPPEVSPELIGRFLDLQQQELNCRAEELSLHVKQEENNKSIAEASISANLQDRDSERQHKERKTKIVFIGTTILVTIATCFACFAIYSGKEAIVIKMLEVAVIFVSGLVGGYGLKTSRVSPKNETES